MSAAATTERYRSAVEVKDVDGVLATMSPDVVLHSPITERVKFTGHAEMRGLLESVFTTIHGVRFHTDIGDEHTRMLCFRGQVAGQMVEEAALLRLDGDAQIIEMTLFIRTLPGLATLAAELAPKIVVLNHSRRRARVARLLMAPLGTITRTGDRFIRFFA